MVVVTSNCFDTGPFCDAYCAEDRNGHPVQVRAATRTELRRLGQTCSNCGNWDEDDENTKETTE